MATLETDTRHAVEAPEDQTEISGDDDNGGQESSLGMKVMMMGSQEKEIKDIEQASRVGLPPLEDDFDIYDDEGIDPDAVMGNSIPTSQCFPWQGKIKAYVDFSEFNKTYQEFLERTGARESSDDDSGDDTGIED